MAPRSGIPQALLIQAKNARLFQAWLAEHEHLPVGLLPLSVLNDNSLSAKEFIVTWLAGSHGRERVTLQTYKTCKLPQEYLDYNELRLGPTPTCSSCQIAGRYTPLEYQWVVRKSGKCACLNIQCIAKLFSNSQDHTLVHTETRLEKKRKEAGTAITSGEEVSTWPEKQASSLDQVFEELHLPPLDYLIC